MAKPNKQKKRITVIVALLVCTAVVFRNSWRIFGSSPLVAFLSSYARSGIYIGMFAVWGISVRHRIMQAQVRRYLVAVSALLVFWMLVRMARFFWFTEPTTARHCWYMFYFPILFIPLLVFLTSLSLGRQEGFRLPKRVNLLFIPRCCYCRL